MPVLDRALQLGVARTSSTVSPTPRGPAAKHRVYDSSAVVHSASATSSSGAGEGHQPLAAAEHGLQLLERRGQVGQRPGGRGAELAGTTVGALT